MVRVKTTALLTTGAAEWRLTGTRGTHIAGKAPACDPHPNWITPAGQGKWLGSAKSNWPVGITEFSLAFQVTDPQIAHFELVYAVDNKLESVTLNGKPLAIDDQKGFKALSVLKAPPLSNLFQLGPNVLVVRVLTTVKAREAGGDSEMGFYAEGTAITGDKEYTALQTASPTRSTATLPLRNWPASPAQQDYFAHGAPLPPSAVLALAAPLPGAVWRCVHEASGRLIITPVGLPLGSSWRVALQDERWVHPHTTRSQVGRCVLSLPSLRTSSGLRVCACLETAAGASEQWSEWRPVMHLSTVLLSLPPAAAAAPVVPAALAAPVAPAVPAPVAPPAPPPPRPVLAPVPATASTPQPYSHRNRIAPPPRPAQPPAAPAPKCDCHCEGRIAELEATVQSQGRIIEEMRSIAKLEATVQSQAQAIDELRSQEREPKPKPAGAAEAVEGAEAAATLEAAAQAEAAAEQVEAEEARAAATAAAATAAATTAAATAAAAGAAAGGVAEEEAELTQGIAEAAKLEAAVEPEGEGVGEGVAPADQRWSG